jgi:hypothetical protein
VDGAYVAGSDVFACLRETTCIGCGFCGCAYLVIIIGGGIIIAMAYGYTAALCFALEKLKIKSNC